MKSDVQSSQRRPRVETFRVVCASVDATPSNTASELTEGRFRGLVSVASDVYTLTFTEPFARAPTAQITCEQSGTGVSFIPNIASCSTTALVWRVENDASAAASPTAFHVMVLGFDSADQL
jgi:hypothetical protein